MPDLKPRKAPRQARSRATVAAILEGCARVLRERGLAGLNTNAIAARAGVGIGSLYEFFPSREAVLAALARERLVALRAEVAEGLEEALRRPEDEGVVFLLGLIVERVAAEKNLFRALLREAPFLRELPETRRAIADLFGLGPLARERALHAMASIEEAGDTWLMGRMLAGAVLDIAFAERGAPARAELVRELARLAFRMFAGRDPRRGGARRSGEPPRPPVPRSLRADARGSPPGVAALGRDRDSAPPDGRRSKRLPRDDR